MSQTNPAYIPQGWQCPKCTTVLAPSQLFCIFCAADRGTLFTPKYTWHTETTTTGNSEDTQAT